MAEIKLFEIDLSQTIVSIERLRNELKVTKKEFEAAEVGSDQFNKLGGTVKTLQAEIKKLTDATKANSNALGGINEGAKFAEGSYGKLKQQIKETKDRLLTLNTEDKKFGETQKELIALENKRIEIEKKIPSLFQERIKGAINEANALKELKAELKAAQAAAVGGDKESIARVAELKDKLDDLTDATKTLKGSGIEQLTASTQLLQEGLANFDLGKLEIAFDGLANSMKALPIFLIIEGIKFLIENIDEAVKFLNSFSAEAQDVKKLEKALADVTRETERQKTVLNGLVEVGNAQIELLKAQGASYDKIISKEKEVFQSKLQLIKVDAEQVKFSALTNIAKLKEIAANDDITESVQRVAAAYQRKLGNDIIADQLEKNISESKKKRSKEVTDALSSDQNKLIELQNSLQVLLLENKTKEIETGKERLQKARELQDFLRQLSIDAIKDEKDRQVNQLIFDEELAKREAKQKIKNKELLAIALGDIEKKFQNEQLNLQKQFAQETYEQEKEKNDKILEGQKAVREYERKEEIAANKLKIEQNRADLDEQFNAKLEQLDIQRKQELEQVNLTYSERLLIEQNYQNEKNALILDNEKRLVEQKKQIRDAEVSIIKDSYVSLINLAQLFADGQEEQAKLAKIGALVNIAANTGTAISNMIAVAYSPLDPANQVTGGLAAFAKIAAGFATITANAVQAKQLVNSFEEGGYTGDGAPNEVSTNLGSKPYTYHKSEYVIPARVLNTPMGAVLASKAESMRLGMSNPMPYIGGMFDGGFTARSASSEANSFISNSQMFQSMLNNLPQPVVKVTDINKVQNNSERAISVSSL